MKAMARVFLWVLLWLVAWGMWWWEGMVWDDLQHCSSIYQESATKSWLAGWLESWGGRTWWDTGCWRLPWFARASFWLGGDVRGGTLFGASVLLFVGGSFFTEGKAWTIAGVLAVILGWFGGPLWFEGLAWMVWCLGCTLWIFRGRWVVGTLFLMVGGFWPVTSGRAWVLCGCLLGILWHFAEQEKVLEESGPLAAQVKSLSFERILPFFLCCVGALVPVLCFFVGWPVFEEGYHPKKLSVQIWKGKMAGKGGAVSLGGMRAVQETALRRAKQLEATSLQQKRHKVRMEQLFRVLQGLRAKEGDGLFRLLLLRADLLPWGWEGRLGLGALRWQGGRVSLEVVRMVGLIQGYQKSIALRKKVAHDVQVKIALGWSWKRIVRWDLLERWGVHWLLSPYPIHLPRRSLRLLRVIRLGEEQWWLYRRNHRKALWWPLRRVHCAKTSEHLWRAISSSFVPLDEAWVLGCQPRQKEGSWIFVSRLWHLRWRSVDDLGQQRPLMRCHGLWSCAWIPKGRRFRDVSFAP